MCSANRAMARDSISKREPYNKTNYMHYNSRQGSWWCLTTASVAHLSFRFTIPHQKCVQLKQTGICRNALTVCRLHMREMTRDSTGCWRVSAFGALCWPCHLHFNLKFSRMRRYEELVGGRRRRRWNSRFDIINKSSKGTKEAVGWQGVSIVDLCRCNLWHWRGDEPRMLMHPSEFISTL